MRTAKCKKHGIYTENEAYVTREKRYKDGIRLRCIKCDHDRKINGIKSVEIKSCEVHGVLNDENAYKSFSNGYARYKCKICVKAYRAVRYSDTRQKSIQQAREWKRNNRERVNNLARQDYKNNPEKYKKWQENFYEKNREEMNAKAICKSHNINREDYDELFRAQESKCAICGKEETRQFKGKTMRLCLDHDHETGKIRSLLCHDCNTGLGKFYDSIDLLTKAAIYLMDNK